MLVSTRLLRSLTLSAGAILALTALLFTSAQAEPVPPGTAEQIRERLAPVGAVCRAGEDCGQAAAVVASGPLSGDQVYQQFCFACHTTGVGGAPKIGDVADWEERQGKGMDTLWDSLLNGIGAMPAKGTCMSCSEDELREVLDYMLAAEAP